MVWAVRREQAAELGKNAEAAEAGGRVCEVAEPPPTHPARKLPMAAFAALDLNRSKGQGPPSPTFTSASSPTTATSRVFRSRSMHYSSAPPLRPISRKRPESVQLSPTVPPAGPFGDAESPFLSSRSDSPHSARSAPPHNITRHLSATYEARERDRSPPQTSGSRPSVPLSHIQKAFTDLHQKAQPRLDSARYKAEAGLMKRGFVRHGGADRRWHEDVETRLVGSDVDDSESSGVDVDPEDTPFNSKVAMFNGEASTDRTVGAGQTDRDDLKWPRGEGWTPL